MASYSIEDIELIRRKSGISYEEAVSLLDYHNGEVARVLIDLERSGKLKDKGTAAPAAAAGKAPEGEKKRNSFLGFLQKLYRIRIKVHKEDTVIVNLSVLFICLAVILFSPHVALLSVILSLLLGYRISIDKDDEAFRTDDLKDLVSSAASNVKRTVGDLTREIRGTRNTAAEKKTEKKPEQKAEQAKEEIRIEVKDEPEPAAEPQPLSTRMPDLSGAIIRDLERHVNGPDVPVIQVPVRVESTDGDIEVTSDDDGFHTATIG